MRCPKCGSENNPNSVYCEKCLTPLNMTDTQSQQITQSASGLTIDTILVIVFAVCIVLSMLILPMFTTGQVVVSGFGVKTRFEDVNDLAEALKRYTSFDSNVKAAAMVPGLLVILSLVFTVAGGVAKKYKLQCISSVLTLVFIQLNYVSCCVFIKMTPNVGYCLCTALSIAIIYSTQRVFEGMNTYALIGVVISAIGAIIGYVGFTGRSGADLVKEYLAGGISQYTSNETMGIVAIVIGLIFTIFAYESEIYKDAKSSGRNSVYAR